MRAAPLVVTISALAVAAAGAGRAAPRGKVVRVERGHGVQRHTPRLCLMQGPTSGMCWGPPPVVGDTALVVDRQAAKGTLQVTAVQPQNATCPDAQAWQFTAVVQSGKLDDLGSSEAGALLDVDGAGSRSRWMEASGLRIPELTSHPNEQPWGAVDLDGDGQPDLVTTAYVCTSPSAPPGGGNVFCVDYWTQARGEWRKIRSDNVTECR